MSHKEIILDTNAYLRLAKSIHPLLGKPFGSENYALYIHKELQYELDRSQRLQTSFYWVEQEEYKKERKKILFIQKNKSLEIENVYDYIWEFQKDNNLKLSREDIYCISTAYVLNITLVTDDNNMVLTAKAFKVTVLYTLELLNLMKECCFVNQEKIDEIVSYLKYINDFPPSFNKLYRKLFCKPPP